jgi:MFS family permease
MLKIFGEILKRYRLFFLIAVTFLAEAVILLIVQNVIQEITIIELIIKNTTQLSILMLVTTFIYLFFVALLENSDNEKSDFAEGIVTRLLTGSLVASSIPTGISLVLCAFTDMKYIKYLSGIEISIGFIGIALMFIAVLYIKKSSQRIICPNRKKFGRIDFIH